MSTVGRATGLTCLNVSPGPGFRYRLGAGTNRGEKLEVNAFGQVQVFDNVTSIEADAGSGDDNIRIAADVTSPALLIGGLGEDILQGGAGNDELRGGKGDDHLIGRAKVKTNNGKSGK